MAKKSDIKIVFWQRVPYDSFAGGDGLYLAQLKNYLRDQGHRIYTITSALDRPRFILNLKYQTNEERRVVRGGIIVGKSCVVIKPISLMKQVFRYAKKLVEEKQGGTWHQPFFRGEKEWLVTQLESIRPDLIIKCFDKHGHSDFSELTSCRSLHLIGFMNEDEFSIPQGAAYTVRYKDIGRDELRNKVSNFCAIKVPVAFSSYYDRDKARGISPQITSIFVGIGFSQRFARQSSSINRVLFIGNKTLPNRKAVEYLLQHIWPNVLMAIPDARLRIVGRVGNYFERPSEGVDFLGEIEDLSAEYENARVVVAPLVLGSAGVKTKIAEGMKYGRAVVTTTLGVDQSNPDQFSGAAFVAQSQAQFIEGVCSLLLNSDLREAMEERSKEVFINNFSEHAAYAEIKDWIDAGT